MLKNLDVNNVDEVVRNQDVTVIDFWAPWCGPCLAFEPVMEQVSKQHPEVCFAKVNIDEQKQLADDFGVRSVPMIMIFRREFVVFAESGTQTQESLKDLIAQAQKIDLDTLHAQLPPHSDID